MFLRQSNYFKGSILVLTYLVIVVGFYLSGYSSNIEAARLSTFGAMAPSPRGGFVGGGGGGGFGGGGGRAYTL